MGKNGAMEWKTSCFLSHFLHENDPRKAHDLCQAVWSKNKSFLCKPKKKCLYKLTLITLSQKQTNIFDFYKTNFFVSFFFSLWQKKNNERQKEKKSGLDS